MKHLTITLEESQAQTLSDALWDYQDCGPVSEGEGWPSDEIVALRHLVDAAISSADIDLAHQLAETSQMLAVLWAEYGDRKAQWGSDSLWEKHEDADAIAKVQAFITQTQTKHPPPPMNHPPQ